MNNIVKYLLAIPVIILILFFASIPYNKYCATSGSCSQISLQTLFPKSHGLGFNIEFNSTNYHELIDFKLISSQTISAHTNQTIIAEFEVTNRYNKIVYFRPRLVVEPREFQQYLEKYQCLCMEEQNIRANETKKLKMVFSLKEEIEDNKLFRDKYLDLSLTTDESEYRPDYNYYPENIKIKYVVENTF